MGKEMKAVRNSTLEDGFHQKYIIDKYMEDENGEDISGEYSEYSDASQQTDSGSGDTEEEVTNIRSIVVTVNVKRS